MKWVKASEKPKEAGAYWCKLNDGLGSKNGAYFDGDNWQTYRGQFILKWLDESSPSPSMGAEEIDVWYFKWNLENNKNGLPLMHSLAISMLKDFASSHQPGGYSEAELRDAVDLGLAISTISGDPFTSAEFEETKEICIQSFLSSLTKQGSGNNKTD